MAKSKYHQKLDVEFHKVSDNPLRYYGRTSQNEYTAEQTGVYSFDGTPEWQVNIQLAADYSDKEVKWWFCDVETLRAKCKTWALLRAKVQ